MEVDDEQRVDRVTMGRPVRSNDTGNATEQLPEARRALGAPIR